MENETPIDDPENAGTDNPVPDPPSEQSPEPDFAADLRMQISELAASVAALSDLVTGMVSDSGSNEPPVTVADDENYVDLDDVIRNTL